MRHPFLEGLRPTLHISHRGGAGLYPENTMVAFEAAVRIHRTDMLELDVNITRDGEVIVLHDATLDRCTDATGPVAALAARDLERVDAAAKFSLDGGRTFPWRGRGVRIPRLAEVLRAFGDLRLNVELKTDAPGAESLVAAAVESAGAERRVCVGSERDEVAGRLLEAMPDACHFFPGRALMGIVLALRAGEPPPPDPGWLVLDMPLTFGDVRLVDAPFLERARALGRWVNVWTVDDPAEMRALIEEGVGGIMTDRPDRLRQALDDLGR